MTASRKFDDRVALTVGDDGVADLRMIRADKLNALDPAMFDALVEAGKALSGMPGLRCVVLSGEGKAFCAGLDLASMAGLAAGPGSSLADRTHGEANLFQQVAVQWRQLPVPVIAAVHGVCFGGGLQIAAGADIRVVAPEARLSVMELKWGIIPDMGGFALWQGVVRKDVLRELTYTAREATGEQAVTLGLATLSDPDPHARAMAIAREIAGRNPHAVRAAKALFNRAPSLTYAEVLLAESHAQQKLLGSKNQMEAVAAGMAKRPPIFVDP
ncbi:MAG: crotonase/enoyl-CoA hydratase family protein [Novosphingobium sp.]